MKWSLLELNKYREQPYTFTENLDLKASLIERDQTIQDVGTVKVTGQLNVEESEYVLHYTVEVVLTLPSSRSLKPVQFPLHLTVNEIFMTKQQFQEKHDFLTEEDIILLDKPTIDLTESVEDNILLAIPLQILSDEEKNSDQMPQGNDWSVISEEEYLATKEQQMNQTVDPRLAKLSELFNESGED